MPTNLRRPLAALAALAVLLLGLAACSQSPSAGEEERSAEGSEEGSSEVEDGEPPPEPAAFIPITGGVSEDGVPEPPPLHVVLSVVVRGSRSWEPYATQELTGLDREATSAMAARLRQLDSLLTSAGVRASIELAYGPASALCANDPELLDALGAGGHSIGINARTRGEALRAFEALAECGITATTASGLAAMADPPGAEPPGTTTLIDAMSVLSVLDIRQVTGAVSRLCTDLGLSAPTHGYGTGAFTAPWRSAWTEGNPCADLPRGRIVVIDQAILGPVDGAPRVDAASFAILANRTVQVTAYALDLRYQDAGDLPHPGVITWGVAFRLDDLIAAPPLHDGDEGDAGVEPPLDPVDARTAPLGEETLAALGGWLWDLAPAVERGRWRWMTPDEVAALLRPAH